MVSKALAQSFRRNAWDPRVTDGFGSLVTIRM